VRRADTKGALVEAALALIGESGAPAFTMREVADRVGVTHPAAYRHFADKRALLAQIAIDGYALLDAEVMPQLARARSRAGRLVAFARAYVAFAQSHEAHFRVMFGPRLNRDGRSPELEAAVQRAYAGLYEALGGREGRVANAGRAANAANAGHAEQAAHDRAFAAWSLAQGYASLLCDGRIPIRAQAADAHVTRLARLLARGIA
jgi:AcrR family transcriptional regulator